MAVRFFAEDFTEMGADVALNLKVRFAAAENHNNEFSQNMRKRHGLT